ncbi:hypothetical protein RI129_000072 [Pyrocoelia pectoralis]|uniref:CCHC-type domain-containing protein n=1 Tax=Pyrocoelia pectoralis TaxID=417401 RepID=A0AAN7ZEC2_9COLE
MQSYTAEQQAEEWWNANTPGVTEATSEIQETEKKRKRTAELALVANVKKLQDSMDTLKKYIKDNYKTVHRDVKSWATATAPLITRVNDDAKKLRYRDREKTDAILIRTDRESYADLLKKIKEGVQDSKMQQEIKSVRLNRARDLIITTTKGKGDVVNKHLQTVVPHMQSRNIMQTKKIHIGNMDIFVERGDVEAAIAKALGQEEVESIQEIRIRPGRTGNNSAEVIIGREAGHKLLDMGRIKIGWNNCIIREWVEVSRCSNCMKMGHSRRDCKEEENKEKMLSVHREWTHSEGL